MAFFDGIRNAIRRVVRDIFGTPKERPKPPPPEPPAPPIGPDFFPPPEESEYEQRLHDEFTYVTGENPSFDNHDDWRDLWGDTGIELTEEENENERVRLYGEFLRAFYLTSTDAYSVPREDYYNDSGLGKNRIDWERFREIKRT